MADGYIQAGELQLYGFQGDIENNQELFDVLIPRASEIFDILCGVEPGYFLQKDTALGEKVVRGTGGALLAIPAHIGSVDSVTVPSGFLVPLFVEESGYLRIVDSLGRTQDVGVPYPETGSSLGFYGTALIWQRGVAYIVKAKWGFEDVPESVKQAVTELSIALWRSKDPAFSQAINLDTNQMMFNPAIPKRVKIIAQAFRNKRSTASAFV